MPWLASQVPTLEELVRRFQLLSNMAAIVGPHGVGKSTLLEHLVPMLGNVFYRRDASGKEWSSGDVPARVVWISLRRRTSVVLRQDLWHHNRLLVVDGLEQLNWLRRILFVGQVRRRKMQLLVTAHRPVFGLPTLLSMCGRLERVQQLVEFRLVSAAVPPEQLVKLLDQTLIHRIHAEERGNIREIFMRLYDVYQSRIPLIEEPESRDRAP